jgi:hypothetical protein
MKLILFKIAATIGVLYAIVTVGLLIVEKNMTDKMPNVILDSALSAQQSVLIRNRIGELKSTENVYDYAKNNGDTISYELVLSGSKQSIHIHYLARKLYMNRDWVILKTDTTYLLN